MTEQLKTQETKSEESKKDVPLSQLPLHSLRLALKEKGIRYRQTDKKKDLIEMLEAGETNHKPREVKRAKHLEESKTEKALPVVPKEIREDLEALALKGLKWSIDEESGCINFKRDIETCANLDQPAKNILMTARLAFGARLPIEKGRNSGEPVEWR